MKILSFSILILFVLLLTSSCKDKTTNPPNNGDGLDTTTHNFIWETFTLEPPYETSQFLDAAIINENDIWVGGYVDSIDIGIAYNAIHFDGNDWELKKVPYYYRDRYIYSSIDWIFSFTNNDIWFGNLVHWDGERFKNANLALSIFVGIGQNNMWGSSNGEFYLAGNQGTVAYSPDADLSWQKLNSSIKSDIRDIWGVSNTKTGQNKVYLVIDNIKGEDSTSVYQIVNNEVIPAPSEGVPLYGFEGIWSADGNEWYACGGELYRLPALNQSWEKVEKLPSIYMEAIRGNSKNDIFVTGYLGLIAHWNGSTWHTYPEMPGNYHGLAVKDDLVVAVGTLRVGFISGPGTILVGRRN